MTTTSPTRTRTRRGLAAVTGLLLAISVTVASGASLPVAAAEASPLFDSSTVHAISVTYDQAAYDALIKAYQDTGDKAWIEATVTIDGTTFEDAGMRLKGNSSLMGLRGGRGGNDGPGGPGGFASVSAEEPQRLPWLIRLDKYVDGQNLDGVADLVVRSNNSQTSLNEAVALELLEAAGLASEQAAPTSFSVNGSAPVLRLIVENPGDTWLAANHDGTGALFKAESTGDWSYRGEDPDAYADVFDQEAGEDVTDLTPLIDFLRFINEADDATFAAELPARLDVQAFATYLAMMDLVDNFDDIDGPGNNAYLHWDAATGVFTIVPWDMNLAFGGLGGMRGFGPGEGMRPPAGFEPGGSFDPGAGFGPGASFDPSQLPGGFGGRNRSNPLVERFHANAAFEARYQEQLTTLLTELFASGTAQAILDRWTSVLTAGASDLVDKATIASEAASIAEQFTGS